VYAAANADQLTMQVVLNNLTLLLKGCGLALHDIRGSSNRQQSPHALLLRELHTQDVLLPIEELQLLGCSPLATTGCVLRQLKAGWEDRGTKHRNAKRNLRSTDCWEH
jgi:hypothetical protein